MATVDLGIGPPPAAAAPDDGEPDVYGVGAGTNGDTAWDDPVATAPEVPEPVVRGILSGLGGLLAMTPLADPDVDDHWRFTPQELDDLTPPVTRIVNARPQLRAAAARGDELVVAVQVAGFVGRNVVTGSMARAARARYEEEHDGQFDRQAPDAEAGGDEGARAPVGGQQGGWIAPPTGGFGDPPSP